MLIKNKTDWVSSHLLSHDLFRKELGMKQENKDVGFRLRGLKVFGLGESLESNNPSVRKILSHLDQGLRLHYDRNEDLTDIENLQSTIL